MQPSSFSFITKNVPSTKPTHTTQKKLSLLAALASHKGLHADNTQIRDITAFHDGRPEI